MLSKFVQIDKTTNNVLDIYTASKNPTGVEDWFEVETSFVFNPPISKGLWRYISVDNFIYMGMYSIQLPENEYTYDDFIDIVSTKRMSAYIQEKVFIENDYKKYILMIHDTCHTLKTIINSYDHPDSILDYETKYQETANSRISNIESVTGWTKVRGRSVSGDIKGTYCYFTTGDNASLDTGNNTTDYTITVGSGYTYLDFSPTYDFEIAGGMVTIHATPSEMSGKNFKVSFILAPDIPVEMGGSYPFIQNKKFCEHCLTYERVVDPKLIRYDPTYYSHKVRVALTYETNPEIDVEIYLDTYVVTS